MNTLDTYLKNLARELGRRGLVQSRIVEEAREHLADAVAAGLAQGLPASEAEQRAVERFGPPALVAEGLARDRYRGLDRWLLAVAVLLGWLIAFVDSRPTWDDTGITACTMLLAASLLAAVSPRRPWLWALAIGVWIPLYGELRTPGLAWALVLAFPMAGAYAGMLFRRAVAGLVAEGEL